VNGLMRERVERIERDYMEWESLIDEHEMLLLQLRKLKDKFPFLS